MAQHICQTPIVVDIQTQSRHVYRVMWVDTVILQYVYCHDYDSNNFSDMTQFSVLQEAWVTCVCYSSWSSSQFHVEVSCCHHVHLYKYIYIYIYIYILLLCQRTSTFLKDASCKVP